MTDEEKENDRRIFQNEHIVGRGRQTGMQNSLLKNREKLLDEPGKWHTTNFYHNKTVMEGSLSLRGRREIRSGNVSDESWVGEEKLDKYK